MNKLLNSFKNYKVIPSVANFITIVFNNHSYGNVRRDQKDRFESHFIGADLVNPDFIKLCLNEDITPEITLQPLKRYDLDAAIIFSDILMLPYGIGQKVEFQKGLGPILGDFNLDFIDKINEDVFTKKLDQRKYL